MTLIRVLFDTNILIYAHDSASIYHFEAADLLAKVFDLSIQGIVAEQVLIEMYRTLTNRSAMANNPLKPEQARSLIRQTYLKGQFEILYPSSITVDHTLDLAVDRQVTSAKIFDLRLASIAVESSVDYLVTYNIKDFQNILGLTVLTPPQLLMMI